MPSSISIQYFSFCVDTAYQWTSEAMHMYISSADVGEAKATLYYALLKTCIRKNLRSLKSSRSIDSKTGKITNMHNQWKL